MGNGAAEETPPTASDISDIGDAPSQRQEESSSATAGAGTTAGAGAEGSAGEADDFGASGTDGDLGTLEQLEGLRSELEAVNERHLRLAAEFDNYRKRITREREEVRRRAEAELVGGLLDALDDLQRVSSYDAEDTTAEAVLEGIRLVEKKVRRALESAGLEAIEAEGHYFNPDSMEGIMTVPADSPEEDDVVADVFQTGYRYGGTLLRPARVQVKKYDES